MEICERLFITMEEKGISQKELIDKIEGLSKSTVSAWKTRKCDPPTKYIVPICNVLGVSVEYLLTGENTSESSLCFPKVTITESDMEFLNNFNRLSVEERAEIKGEIRAILRLASRS